MLDTSVVTGDGGIGVTLGHLDGSSGHEPPWSGWTHTRAFPTRKPGPCCFPEQTQKVLALNHSLESPRQGHLGSSLEHFSEDSRSYHIAVDFQGSICTGVDPRDTVPQKV